MKKHTTTPQADSSSEVLQDNLFLHDSSTGYFIKNNNGRTIAHIEGVAPSRRKTVNQIVYRYNNYQSLVDALQMAYDRMDERAQRNELGNEDVPVYQTILTTLNNL